MDPKMLQQMGGAVSRGKNGALVCKNCILFVSRVDSD